MGCGIHNNVQVQPLQVQVLLNNFNINNFQIPQGFINTLQEHNQNIVNSSKNSMDQQSTLLHSFQFFKFNSRYLWFIAINHEYCKANIDLIISCIEDLLSILPTYIKSNMTYTLYICQILDAYAKILFQFFVTNGKRYLNSDIQNTYLNLLTTIEQQLYIERDNDPFLNNVEFELFQIKSAFALIPTDTKEGQEILNQFLGGALKAAITFTLNNDLLESLQKGVIYIYNEYKKHQIKRKFELIYYITGLKYSIMEEIDTNSDFVKIFSRITEFYQKIIKDCVDWEIQCSWIQSISQIINYKIRINPQDLQENIYRDCLQKSFIIKIKEQSHVNINNFNIQNDLNAQTIFQQVKQLQLLSNLQQALIQGNPQIQGFEGMYKTRMKLQNREQQNLIDKSTLNSAVLHIKNLTKQQKKIEEQIQNKVNNNYLDALINDQLEETLLLDQDLRQLTQQKANLLAIVIQGTSIISAAHQIAVIHYLIDILKSNNSQLQDDNFNNTLKSIGINLESHNVNNKNLIFLLQKLLKSINCANLNLNTMETHLSNICNIFEIIDKYEAIIFHNLEFLLQLQMQVDQNEAIKICDYHGLEGILNQLHQIFQFSQSDKGSFQIETFQQISKIQSQLNKLIINLRHTNLKICKLSKLKVNVQPNVTKRMLKIQESSIEEINRLIAGIKKVQVIIMDSKNNSTQSGTDSSIISELIILLNNDFIFNLNPIKIESLKEMAINFKKYVTSVKDCQLFKNEQEKMQTSKLNSLEFINLQFSTISVLRNINSEDEQCWLMLLKDLQSYLQNHQAEFEQNSRSNQNVCFDSQAEINLLDSILISIKLLNEKQLNNLKNIQQCHQLSELIEGNMFYIKVLLQQRGEKYKKIIEIKEQNIINYQKQQLSILGNLTLDLQDLNQRITSHSFLNYPKQLESQIVFIFKSIYSQNITVKHNQFDQFADQIEDTLNKSHFRIRQFIIYELLQMQSNLFEPSTVATNQEVLFKLQIYETDSRIKTLFQSPQQLKLQTQLMEQYWPSIEEQVQKYIKDKLEQLNSIVCQIESQKYEQKKQRLQKQFKELQYEINEQMQNISSITSCLGITVIFLEDLKSDLTRMMDTLNQIQLSIKAFGQDLKALRGKSYWELLELRMKKVLDQMNNTLAETIYIQIKTRVKQNDCDHEEESNLFTDDLFGDGEVNEFIWKETKDSMLIHGLAGSGKSTSSKKIEEFIWRIYEKCLNETDIIPIVPIFIQLPTLKEPNVYAVEETLKSDNYRFNNKQIDEMKEGVNQGKLRLILIFDSYDELKQQYIGKNLYNSNKLEKWRKQGDSSYPKVITTSRTELFTTQEYYRWFISDQDSKYKEIRLVKFNDTQIELYIEQFVCLTKKLTVKEFSKIQDTIEFERQWRRDIISDQDLQFRLENFISKEKISQTKYSLDQLWSAQQYRVNIEQANLKNLLETPFMMEIVMQVLPKVAEQFNLGKKHQKLQLEKFTTFNFYSVFFDFYFDRQILKQQSKGEIIDLKKQLWDFTVKLALEMTTNNLSSVYFESNGLVFKKEHSDWRDIFFNDDCDVGEYKRLFRQCIPIRQKLGNFSFNHKSLQEFLVAKWFIENIDKIQESKYYCEVNWRVEYFKGVLKFINTKANNDEVIQNKLKQILESTRDNDSLIIAGSNSIYILQKLNYNFEKQDLSKIQIQDVNLEGINFSNCKLDGSVFNNVNLCKANLIDTSLNNCKWLNMNFDQFEQFLFQDCSIDKIKLIQGNIYFLNTINGQIQLFDYQKKKLVYTKLDKLTQCIDYIEFRFPMILRSNCVEIILQMQPNLSCDIDNASTKLVNCENEQFIVNGHSLLMIQYDYKEFYGPEYYQANNLRTRVLIDLSTEFISYKNGFILASHQGSFISLYNLKIDKIIFQSKYTNQLNITSIDIFDDCQFLIGGSDYSIQYYINDTLPILFLGHFGAVSQLQFIENKYFLSASREDYSIKLWSISYKQILWQFLTSIDITSLQVILYQNLLVIGSSQGILQLINFDYPTLIKCEYSYHKAGIICCAKQKKSVKLASGSSDNVIKIWDIQTGLQIGLDMIHKTPLCLAFDLNRDYLYSGEQQGFVVEWDLKTYLLHRKFDNYGDSVTHLSYEHYSIYFRSTDSIVKIIDSTRENQMIKLNFLRLRESKVNQDTYVQDENLKNFQFAQQCPEFQEIIANEKITQITRIIISIESQYYAFGTESGNLIVQNKDEQRIENQIFTGSKIIELLELKDNQLICVSQQGYKIIKINKKSIDCLKTFDFKKRCSQVILQKNFQGNQKVELILVIVFDKEITLSNLQTTNNDSTIQSIKWNKTNQITTITLVSQNTQILYCGTKSGKVQVWDIKNQKMIHEISVSKLSITKVIYLEQSNQLILSSEDGNVYFMKDFEIQSKQLQSEKPIKYMEVSQDEQFIILAHQRNLTLWDIFETKIHMIDSFGEFQDISAFSVNFAHLYLLIGDQHQIMKIPLSLRRISQFYSEEMNHYPTCFTIGNTICITGDYKGKLGFWERGHQQNREFYQTDELYINQIQEISPNSKIFLIIIAYESRIVVINYNSRQVMYSCSFKNKLVSCNFLEIGQDKIYFGVDCILNCLEIDLKCPEKSIIIQLSQAFGKFDNILSIEDYLIISSKQCNQIRIYSKKSGEFIILYDYSGKLNCFNSEIIDSKIYDKFGNDCINLFVNYGAFQKNTALKQSSKLFQGEQ